MSEDKQSNKLQWAMYVLIPLVTILSGSEVWQYAMTPSKIEEVTHRPEALEEDSIRTEKIATEIMDKLLDDKLPTKIIQMAAEERFGEDKAAEAMDALGELVDSADVNKSIKLMTLQNRLWLQSMFGYGREIEGQKYFVSPYKHNQKLFYSVPEGRNWVEEGWWRLDEVGTAQAIPSYKNIKLK